MWFTETAWPPMLVMLTLATISGLCWVRRRQIGYLLGVLALIAAAGITWYAEQAIVTDAERVEQAIRDVASAFVSRDVERTQSFFTPELQPMVTAAFALVEQVDNLRLTDIQVQMLAQDSRAHTHFRANGTVRIRGPIDIGHHPSRWHLTWQKEGGRWRVIKIERLHPLTGEEVGVFARE